MAMSTTTAPQTSPRRKVRRPQARTLRLHEAMLAIAARYERLTVRQLFYQLVRYGIVPKTERDYDRIQDASVQLRRAGRLPYGTIADGGRSRRRVPGWHGLGELLQTYHQQYRRDYWATQPRTVEIWCEKDALAGVITPICDEYGATFVSLHGFGSLTIAYESARELR